MFPDYLFPPVEDFLLNKYGHLFGVSSFEELNNIIKGNMEGLTKKEKQMISLRFDSKLRGRMISSKLKIHLIHCYDREANAISKVLMNIKSKQLRNMGKERILNMSLSEFSDYMPFSSNNSHNSRLRSSLSRIKDKNVKDIVDSGPSFIDTGMIGAVSYERLRRFLSGYGIKLEKDLSLYESNIKKYSDALSIHSLEGIKKAVYIHKGSLEPLEFKVLSMRIDRKSLQFIGKSAGLTRERVRKIESYALKKVKFYHELSLKKYKKNDILNMQVSEFADLIPPARDHKAIRIKRILSTCFPRRNLTYLVENVDKLAECPDFHTRCYESLRDILGSYGIATEGVDQFAYYKTLN